VKDRERVVDELSLAILELPNLQDENKCITQLMQAGWRAAVILACFDEAMALAKMTQADWQQELRAKHV
jgi:hypothetical protein